MPGIETPHDRIGGVAELPRHTLECVSTSWSSVWQLGRSAVWLPASRSSPTSMADMRPARGTPTTGPSLSAPPDIGSITGYVVVASNRPLMPTFLSTWQMP